MQHLPPSFPTSPALHGRTLFLAATLACSVLCPSSAFAQWADCASAPANSKQCVPSANGNVGIGTANPGATLDIAGTIITALRINGTTGNTGSNNTQLRFAGGTQGDLWAIGTDLSTNNGSRNFQFYDLKGNLVPITLQSGTGNVGIGTTTPGAMLGVHQPTASPAVTQAIFSSPYANAGDYQQILFAYDQNNLVASAGIRAIRYATADYGASLAFVTSAHAVGGAIAERMRIDANGNVGIGTTSPQSKLAVNGIITTKEVVVTNTGWADYVLKPGYELRPLTEVAAFIKENGRLPEIPSEAEVKQHGVSMGEMQAKLLAKVEELTLHMIQEHDRNSQLQVQYERLEDLNAKLLKQIGRLEARQQ